MNTVTIQEIRNKGSQVFNELTTLIVNSKPKAVIVPIDVYEAMVEAIEDADDIRVAKERENEELIPIDEL